MVHLVDFCSKNTVLSSAHFFFISACFKSGYGLDGVVTKIGLFRE